MDSTAFAASLALFAGAFGAAQVAVMGRLGERIGALEAVMLAAIVTEAGPGRPVHEPRGAGRRGDQGFPRL